jgi:hypothetical protein
MSETVLPSSAGQAELGSLLGLGALSSAAYGTNPAYQDAEQDVSVAGVMLLSAMSVLMAILAMVTLALFVIGGWWVISHIPVPPVVMHLLVMMHLATA